MHEYHLVERIAKEALAGPAQGGLAEIFLCVSESSGLDPESIKLYFEELRPQQPRLKDTKLNIRLEKVKLNCPRCNFDFERIEKSFSCPKCFGPAGRCASHKDIYIEKLEYKL